MDISRQSRFGTLLRKQLRSAATLALIAGTLGLVATGSAMAQAFPTRPVHIVVPAAAGGGVDLVARALAEKMAVRLGQSVLIDNKAGGATNIGSDFVAKAAPDGYTLLMASPSNSVNISLFKTMPYNVRRDLIPVMLVGSMPGVLIVNPAVPARTIAELVALAKSKPGALSYGAGGFGTTEHLAPELFKLAAGIDVKGVMYKGGAPAMIDVIGGHVQFMVGNQLQTMPQIRAGKVRPLATTDTQRSSALPDVPTFAEAGYPEVQVLVWWGLMAPAGTPPAVIARLNSEAVASANSPEFRAFLGEMGGRVAASTPSQFGTFLDSEITRWAKVVKTSGLTAD